MYNQKTYPFDLFIAKGIPVTNTKNTEQNDEAHKKSAPGSFYKKALDQFIEKLDSLHTSFPLIDILFRSVKSGHNNNLSSWLAQNAKPVEESKDSTKKRWRIPVEKHEEYTRFKRKISNIDIANQTIPESFLVSAVSQYDAFIGNVIRSIYSERPEILKPTERAITFAELINIGSIEQARDHIIDKEIEAALRESHSKQFGVLEKLASVTLRPDPNAWTTFIELTERRNLLAHAGGKVSRQYQQVCRDAGMADSKIPPLGTQLNVDRQYLNQSLECLYAIAVKLLHAIWRKTLPNCLEESDESLCDIAYNLIFNRRYRLAIDILEFSTSTIKKHSTARWQVTHQINLAQAYKWHGEEKKCSDVLNQIDFSALGPDFRIAKYALSGETSKLVKAMRELGNNNNYVNKTAYLEWPIFREVRKNADFQKAYKELFNEEIAASKPQEPDSINKTVLLELPIHPNQALDQIQ